jgi:hypothetical protein
VTARVPVAAALAAVLLGGCFTTRVSTSEPGATIWFDGRPVGKSGRIWSVGPPHTARVLAIAKDGRRGRTMVDRQFTWVTFGAGLRTLGVCFVFCWTYPEDVTVPLPPALPVVGWDVDPRADPWGAAADDSAWSRAPGGRGRGRGNASAKAIAAPNVGDPPHPELLPPLTRGEREVRGQATSSPTPRSTSTSTSTATSSPSPSPTSTPRRTPSASPWSLPPPRPGATP